MAILEKYRDYFDIDPDYFPAVNESVINSRPDLWKKFYPHETFVRLIKNTVDVLDRKQKLSIWVEGAYGTGKSHAVLTLKKLLDASEAETKEYFDKYHLDSDLENNLQRIKKRGKLLTVHRYGSSGIHGDLDLVGAIQESIEQALDSAGLKNKASASLKRSIIRYLSDPENKASFSVYVKGESYRHLFGGDSVEDIIDHLNKYSGLALQELMGKIFKVAKERQIKAFTMTTRDLAVWIKEVIKANGLQAIVFIWDEFKEYFDNNASNLTGFQELVEISETDPFYFILVTHVSAGLFSNRDQDFIKLNDRFVKPHCQIRLPENIAFQLMGAAMEKNTDPDVQQDWEVTVDDLQDRTKESRKQVKESARIGDKDLKDILPIHPYAALLLKHIASAFDSNQRSMFDFIKNDTGDEIKGFQWYIDNYGPMDDNPLLTIDMLWDFFYEKNKDLLAQDIRNILNYFERVGNKQLGNDEQRVLKTVLLLQAISQHAGGSVQLFIPNEKNIDYAFEGSNLDGGAASRCAAKLYSDHILFKKPLGGDKFQYIAYVTEANVSEIERHKEDIDRKTTTSLITEPLVDQTTVAEVISLKPALKLRYKVYNVSGADFDAQIRKLRNQEEENENSIIAVVCFAKTEKESIELNKKIRTALNDGSYHMVFIDATTTPLGNAAYERYRDAMAQHIYYQRKDDMLSGQYANNAKDELKKWKARIGNGEFIVYTKAKPEGERVTTLDGLYDSLAEINRRRFPCSLEAAYNVIDNMYMAKNLGLGVECGANQKTSGTFASSNPATKLENALKDAWLVDRYWEKHPSLLISKIKIKVDSVIDSALKKDNRIAIRDIYETLKVAPYGFMPCNLTAFILGFLLKEYTDGSYSWSDFLTNDILNVSKLKEMVTEIIQLQNTPNARYKEKYIVAMSGEEKAFNEATSIAFGIPQNLCTAVEQTRERIRGRMKELGFPIWGLKTVLNEYSFTTPQTVLGELIDLFCGIANSNNFTGTKTESDIALDIGRRCIANPHAAEDLKSLLTKERCTEGMKVYLKTFEDGRLPALAAEVDDNGQYINALRKKFDADAANWVWNVDTAQQKIKEAILEYEIIAESNKLIDRTTSFDRTIAEWCEKCQYIRISYDVVKNYLDEKGPFLELLCRIKKTGNLPEAKKQNFLELLRAYGRAFHSFRSSQLDLFKRACAYYLDGLSDEEIKDVFQTIQAGSFTMDKTAYVNMVDEKVQDYRNNLGKAQLKKLWQEKTASSSPREWSKKHRMPILCLIQDSEMLEARAAFDTINKAHPDAVSVKKAIAYLEKATFFSKLNDTSTLDRIFSETVLKRLAVILTDVEEVKNYLEGHISTDAYNWLGLPEVERKLEQMAEAKYIQSSCNLALEKIDEMDMADVKRYLKELIKDNMNVGIEIIKGR